MPTIKVVIRPFQFGDEKQVKDLLHEATMCTAWPLFVATARRELVSQLIILVAAVLFVVIGLPLSYSMMAFPAVMTFFFVVTWAGHKMKAMTTHHDLSDITKEYQSDPRCGFWVAELLDGRHQSHFNTKVEIVNASDSSFEVDRLVGGRRSGIIVGSVAVAFKNDDSSEPHHSVAWLRRMAVANSHRRLGIGAALTDVVLDHCAKANFRAIELLTTEFHQAARSLYASKGFELIESHPKIFMGGLIHFSLHRLRVPCILTRSNLNA